MDDPQLSVYLGEESTEGFAGFIAEANFYCILEAEYGLSSGEGREALKKINDSFLVCEIKNIHELEDFLTKKIQDLNLPTSISLAAGYLKNGIFYLKTVGNGEIYLLRGKQFAKIISNDACASGYIEERDFYVLTSTSFSRKFSFEEGYLKKVLFQKSPQEAVDTLALQLKTQEDKGLIALLLKFEKRQEDSLQRTTFTRKKGLAQRSYEALSSYSQRSGKKKTLTLIAVVGVFFVLVWSVLMGNVRRSESQAAKRVEDTATLIHQNLSQAEEEAFLNLPKSLELISQSKKEVEMLKKELGDKKSKEIEELMVFIKEKENTITKKEEKTPEEFYDLSVRSENAKATKLAINGESVAMLDSQSQMVYILSLTKKSLDPYNLSGIQNASLIGLEEDGPILYLKDEGIVKVSPEGKMKKIIEKDKDWGSIGALCTYNGNVYLLDTKQDEIYKYIPTDNGYSGKSSYFKSSQATDLEEANSLAIDSSIYIGFQGYALKYTGGLQDGFKTSFPQGDIAIVKWFTDENTEKVFGWDKENSVIYVMGKDGTYERQIHSSILKTGDDIVVFENSVYVLVGSKLFKIIL